MKTRCVSLIFVAALLCLSSGCVKEPKAVRPKEITGVEWLRLPARDRQKYILAAIEILEVRGAVLSRSPEDYSDAVEKRLEQHPELSTKNVTSMLASIVYESEPKNRIALDKFSEKPQVKKI